ncbi:MAG TPA: SRPBCC domain-containing protein [Dictyobacter sp.]|jgi:carbon monoxide dehydrogenase subunit G|nr:SRPBCC domain-containing protein [Dictyobacter sp.]
MNIEGTRTLQAPPIIVWSSLLDRPALLATLPGVEDIQPIKEGQFEITVSMKSPPFNGTYHANLTFADQQYPRHYRFTLEGKTLQCTGDVNLTGQGNMTIVDYKGSITLKKTGARVTPMLVKGGAKLFMQQYFHALADYLHTIEPATSTTEQHEAANHTNIIIPPPPLKTVPPTIMARLIHLFRIGHGDPTQEARWEHKIRRFSMISGLLILVWVGTRLPRRH